MALIGSLIYIIMYYLVGLIIGYSNSPLDHSFAGVLLNGLSLIVIAITEEIIRSSYIKSSQENKRYTNIVLITILFTIVNIGIENFSGAFNSSSVMVIFLLKYFFPSLIMNLFLSYLIYREGIISSLLYKLPFIIIYLLTPVFPTNNYAIICIISSIVPLFVYFKIEKDYFSYIKFNIKERFSGFEKTKFTIFILFITLITFFTSGFYPVKPVVILTGSMAPAINRGDVVIYSKINYNDIEIGDVIVYNLNKIKVIHRVIDIQTTSKYEKILITKGDNNSSRDNLSVKQNQVLGKLIGIIPKMGYPTILIKEFLSDDDNVEVETGN
ncbi:MAG: signal peptidase I [Bacilli bacterium]|nr:signal peptidase I [Bacilli bacterium]